MPNETPQERIQRLKKELESNKKTPQAGESVTQRISRLREEAKSSPAPVEQQPQPEEGGSFLGDLAREIVRPAGRIGANIALAGEILQGDTQGEQRIRSQGVDFPFVGNVKPIGQSGNAPRDLLDALGIGTEIASTFLPASRAPSIFGKFVSGKVRGSIVTGAKTGLAGGGLFGAGREAQDPESTLGSIAGQGALGGAFGLATGGVLGGGSALAGKIPAAFKFRQNPKKVLQTELDDFFRSKKSLTKSVEKYKNRKNTDVLDTVSRPEVFSGIKVTNGTLNVDDAISTLAVQNDALMSVNKKIFPALEQFAGPIDRSLIKKAAFSKVTGTPRQRALTKARIEAELDFLPDNLSLTAIDRFRAQARVSGRNAQGIQKDFNAFAALENGARDVLFERAQKAASRFGKEAENTIALLRNEIKNNINTQEFLRDVLQGTKAPGGRLNILFGRTIGAIAGVKGGPLGSLVGSEVGAIVSRVLLDNRLGSSAKMRLIRNMTDDPQILRAAEQLLGEIQKFNPFDTPGLPAPAIRLPGAQ